MPAGESPPICKTKGGESPRLSFGSFLCLLPHTVKPITRKPFRKFLFASFSLPASRVRVCMCAIRLWLGSKPLAHYISRIFQLGTCAQALRNFLLVLFFAPCQHGCGGVAFRYIMVEAVGWFAYRFQHGRKWWPLLAFLCLFSVVIHPLAQMPLLGISVACKHKGNISRLLS